MSLIVPEPQVSCVRRMDQRHSSLAQRWNITKREYDKINPKLGLLARFHDIRLIPRPLAVDLGHFAVSGPLDAGGRKLLLRKRVPFPNVTARVE